MRHILFTYLDRRDHVLALFILTIIISLVLAYLLQLVTVSSYERTFQYFALVFILLVFISVGIEYFHRGHYLHPLEVYDIKFFFKQFLKDLEDDSFRYSAYFNTYDSRTKKVFESIFLTHTNFLITSIKKDHLVYVVSIYNKESPLLSKLSSLLLSSPYNHKLHIRKINGSYKIIHIN